MLNVPLSVSDFCAKLAVGANVMGGGVVVVTVVWGISVIIRTFNYYPISYSLKFIGKPYPNCFLSLHQIVYTCRIPIFK